MRPWLCLPLAGAAAFGLAAAEERRAAPRPPGPLETSCVVCHSQLDGAALEPTRHTDDDIHFQKGLSCHDCHGGDPAAGADGDPFAAHDESKGFTGKPSRLRIPEFCARCHSDPSFMKRFAPQARVDQYSEYATSVHGQRNAAGDERTAVCVDCHGVHGISAVKDPRSPVHPLSLADTCARCHANADLMRQYGLRADQLAQYKTSVHAHALHEKGDLSAPTCNDCHGSHGAVPPGVENIANVCGSCHGREATLFREIEKKRGLDLEACIQCLVCHGNHAVLPPTDDMVGVGPDSTCTGCHAEADAGHVAAARMAESIGRVRNTLAEAERILDGAERAGVEVGPDRFALQKAHDSLIEARVLVHSFDMERFEGVASEGIAAAEEGVAAGKRAFTELRSRRIGLALSLVIIAAVITSLALTIRRLER